MWLRVLLAVFHFDAEDLLLYFGFLFLDRFFEITWQEEFDEELQQNTTRYYPTELRINSHYISIYVTWMYLVFMYIIPFTTLAVFNFLTW